MKKLLPAVLVTAVAFGLIPGAPAHAGTPDSPDILLDGVSLPFPVAPMIVDGRTMVPFRAIAEALGVSITWNGENQSIDAQGLTDTVHLAIGDKTMLVNGARQTLDVAPMIVNDRTLIPLRAFSTAFRAQVNWDATNYAALITSPIRPMRTMAFYAISSFSERQYVARFSDAAYGWARLTGDGTVDLTHGQDYHWPAPAGDITGDTLLADAARAGTKRHLMIAATDKDGALSALVLDPAKRTHAADQIAATVTAHGFDGAVLDLEGLGLDENGDALKLLRSGFVQLVTEVGNRLHGSGKQLIVAVHPLNGAYHGYDYAGLIQQADMLEVMAHDYNQDGKPEPTDKVIEAIDMSLNAVGATDRTSPLRQKLMLGIVSAYETPVTLQQKAGLAKRYGLAGVSVWRLGMVGADSMAALDATVSPLK